MKDDSRKDWIIVFDGQAGFIGKPGEVGEAAEYVTLCPAFEYRTEIVVTPGEAGRANLVRQRIAVPLESFASANVPVTVRRGYWYCLGDFDDVDRKEIEKTIDQAIDLQQRWRTARSGISLVTTMPVGLPKPPGTP